MSTAASASTAVASAFSPPPTKGSALQSPAAFLFKSYGASAALANPFSVPLGPRGSVSGSGRAVRSWVEMRQHARSLLKSSSSADRPEELFAGFPGVEYFQCWSAQPSAADLAHDANRRGGAGADQSATHTASTSSSIEALMSQITQLALERESGSLLRDVPMTPVPARAAPAATARWSAHPAPRVPTEVHADALSRANELARSRALQKSEMLSSRRRHRSPAMSDSADDGLSRPSKRDFRSVRTGGKPDHVSAGSLDPVNQDPLLSDATLPFSSISGATDPVTITGAAAMDSGPASAVGDDLDKVTVLQRLSELKALSAVGTSRAPAKTDRSSRTASASRAAKRWVMSRVSVYSPMLLTYPHSFVLISARGSNQPSHEDAPHPLGTDQLSRAVDGTSSTSNDKRSSSGVKHGKRKDRAHTNEPSTKQKKRRSKAESTSAIVAVAVPSKPIANEAESLSSAPAVIPMPDGQAVPSPDIVPARPAAAADPDQGLNVDHKHSRKEHSRHRSSKSKDKHKRSGRAEPKRSSKDRPEDVAGRENRATLKSVVKVRIRTGVERSGDLIPSVMVWCSSGDAG